MEGNRKIRVLVGKPGLDGHTIGLQVISRAFRDAGFEVVYAGILLKPSEIVEIAMQEDVDVIGISTLSNAHMSSVPKILNLLKEKKMLDVPVILGGVVPDDDAERLKEMGLAAFFGPGSDTGEIIACIKRLVERKTAGTEREPEGCLV